MNVLPVTESCSEELQIDALSATSIMDMRQSSLVRYLANFMKLKLQYTVIVAALMTFSAIAQEPQPAAKPPEPPGKQKLSYALGMNLGLQIKHASIDTDIDVLARAIKDVLEGKGTEIQEPEIGPLLKQAEGFGRLKQISKSINQGSAFLARNAKEPGITVLPDGLQYRVIKTGTGDFPKRSELVTLNFKGTWIDGTEFRHNDHLDIPFLGCTKGLQEALLLMKTGSKWQIYVPYNLAYGRLRDRAVGFGSTLIYDLELISAELEGSRPNQHHGPGGQAGHSLDEALLPSIFRYSMDNTSETK
jgi:FKBP-type peptidyl-prolyl cis-trans isomerase FklB